MNAGRIGPFFACGKINWSLLTTGAREDGYHLLDTVMQRITLADEITLFRASEWGIECPGSQAPEHCKNTAMIAAKAYAAASGITDAYTISILKKIPVGAGLGGGSADAAAVLSALNGKYNALSKEELLKLALSVGADVPFCLAGGCARCTGVGEVMAPVENAGEYHLVVAGCGANLSTAKVFQHYDGLLAAEAGRRDTDIPLFGRMDEALMKTFPFPWEEDRPGSAPKGEEAAEPCSGEGALFAAPEPDWPEPEDFAPRTGEELTQDLVAALASGSAEGVAGALAAFSRRMRGNDPTRAAVCGVPCDVRYAAEADCTICIAGAKSVLCGANDLTCAACDLAPGVAETLLRLRLAGAMAASMSGSGSACFGLFKDRAAAEEAAKKLSDLPFCAVCSTEKTE